MGPPRALAQEVEVPQVPSAPRALVIAGFEAEGNHRTSIDRIRTAAGLTSGEPATAEVLFRAAERLRRTGLFQSVELHTRPGDHPGQIVVVFRVEESRPHFRFGVGYEDLSGWYLIPIQLNLDNVSGRGEHFRLGTRLGFRVGGLVASYERPSLQDPRRYWRVSLRSEAQQRLYYFDRTEIAHRVNRGAVDLAFGLPLTGSAQVEAWLSFVRAEVDSSADVHQDSRLTGRSARDDVPFGDLPASIRAGVDDTRQSRGGLSFRIDTRSGPGLRQRGLWGRTYLEAVHSSDSDDFVSWQWDLRGYVPFPGGAQLAARTRAGVISKPSPFYERFYLGGLYTVRGYPSQSLSPPGGDLRFGTASLELRAPWVGSADNPRVVGLAFLDLGLGWDGGNPSSSDGAAGIGYGWRVRLPWVIRLGLDVGVPLSSAPISEAFHANLSLGWTF